MSRKTSGRLHIQDAGRRHILTTQKNSTAPRGIETPHPAIGLNYGRMPDESLDTPLRSLGEVGEGVEKWRRGRSFKI
ncbi:MAG: hypothetical protein U9N60_06960 [Thermodesulfobacteriota bacterium]|nr:hypothetical protein [Thermodesulfobacteriota bacterium]